MKLPKNHKWNMSGGFRFGCVILLLVILLLLGLFLNINIGSVSISVRDILLLFWKGIRYGFFTVMKASTEGQIVFGIRMPRMLLAAILGGGLSVSGFLLQAFFRNPIAGPFVLGISSGAKMTVGCCLIVLSGYFGYVSSAVMILAAFAGSLLITSVILFFSGRVKNMSMLLVIGIMIGYICGAVTDLFIAFADEYDILNLTNWSMGTFSGSSWENVKTALYVCIPCLIASWLLSKPMEAYSLGEGYAGSMGINIKGFRILLLLISSLLSACVTALCGPVSFVGIAVPHITRTLLKSAKPALLIPASFLCGGVFCVFCDLIARTVFAPTELAIGTVTSVFGAPIVIYMMIKRRKLQED